MVKGNKPIKKKIDKDVMILTPCNCAALVKLDDDGNIHKDYKDMFEGSKFEELDFSFLKLSCDKKNLYMKNSMYGFEFITWFIKVLRAIYSNSKISEEDLCYKETEKKDFPCLITYSNVGMILSPRVKNG